MCMQSLKKTGQKVLKLEHGNEALTDRRMDGQTDTQSSEGITWSYIYINAYANFIEIPLFMLKKLTKNAFWT